LHRRKLETRNSNNASPARTETSPKFKIRIREPVPSTRRFRVRSFWISKLFRISVFGFRVLGLTAGVFRPNAQCDSAASGKLGSDNRFARGTRFHEIIKDAIGHCLVERALAAVRREIKLERF